MSKAFFSESGVGIDIFCDTCPCAQCGDFENYSVVYVDKHATGTGDGSSWANAYTDIQTAINAHPKKEIQIQGYGETDTYPGDITLLDCTYLKGINDMWIDDTGDYGINGNNITTTKLESINVKNTDVGFYYCFNLTNCTADYCRNGFSYCFNATLTDCHGTNNDMNFYYNVGAIHIGCTASGDSGDGFRNNNGSIFIDCQATLNFRGFAYNTGACTFTNCSATSCDRCGFVGNTDGVYVGCTDSNNCTGGWSWCTPGDPDYGCDEV